MGVAELLFKLLLTTTKNKELFEAAVFLSLSLSLSLSLYFADVWWNITGVSDTLRHAS
jgi:hypothetical protein